MILLLDMYFIGNRKVKEVFRGVVKRLEKLRRVQEEDSVFRVKELGRLEEFVRIVGLFGRIWSYGEDLVVIVVNVVLSREIGERDCDLVFYLVFR